MDVLARYGQARADHFNITLLDPAYRLHFGPGDVLEVREHTREKPAVLLFIAFSLKGLKPSAPSTMG